MDLPIFQRPWCKVKVKKPWEIAEPFYILLQLQKDFDPIMQAFLQGTLKRRQEGPMGPIQAKEMPPGYSFA